jgi:predicted nucleic acid-binding protein
VAVLYLDTSALVKIYVQEKGTEQIRWLAHPDAGHRLAILSLSRVEFRAAVRRRARLGDIDAALADAVIRSFGQNLAGMFQMQPVSEAVLERAAEVVDRRGLRAYDALQLAGCIVLRATLGDEVETQFVCADIELLEAARREGLKVVNPAA